jgi:hypothetical protein
MCPATAWESGGGRGIPEIDGVAVMPRSGGAIRSAGIVAFPLSPDSQENHGKRGPWVVFARSPWKPPDIHPKMA